jgi:hypothetical protein
MPLPFNTDAGAQQHGQAQSAYRFYNFNVRVQHALRSSPIGMRLLEEAIDLVK